MRTLPVCIDKKMYWVHYNFIRKRFKNPKNS